MVWITHGIKSKQMRCSCHRRVKFQMATPKNGKSYHTKPAMFAGLTPMVSDTSSGVLKAKLWHLMTTKKGTNTYVWWLTLSLLDTPPKQMMFWCIVYIYLSHYLYIYPYGWQTIGMTLCIHNCSFLDSQLMDDDNLQYRQGGAIPEPAINRGVEAVVSAIFMFVEWIHIWILMAKLSLYIPIVYPLYTQYIPIIYPLLSVKLLSVKSH